MLKRILLLLGETPSSVSARTYAFALAQQTGAELSGLAGIDLSYIETRMPGVAGGTDWKWRLEEQLRKQADDMRLRLHETFERECIAHHNELDWLSFVGDPLQALQMAVETRDLVITGHDTAFHGNIREQLPEMLSQLLLMPPRPVVVCPDELPKGDDILIAYDGSLPAMRAVQLFALLGIGKARRIHVTSIDTSQELAARRTSGVMGYLHNHGYRVEANPITSTVHPSEVLRIEISDRKIGTLVMGAYGHRGFRELLFGSTTASLVEAPHCALFIYH
ncbi:universal stress protein UspA [Bradyrhizobium sp. CCBAU 051011]|uniref:universal stress protein n=1 Tax=Bradyrhizobium sp. CCBAU 051011 TaxID=858422 RepID=UPI0013738325|nr:universal stress protein [Bradyrhizobium sp. CCBAU 051011]QHO75672.1 universal stress protein UspA [Bradyrhizobium sp. CCBAU 051011]